MAENRTKYLVKNTLIFTIGDFGSKIITFFLVPIYTNALNTKQYGTVDLVTTIATILVPIITLNICESVMRFALDKNADHEKITLVGTRVFEFALIIGLLIIPICSLFDSISTYSVEVYFYIITLAASQLYLSDLRGKELLVQYSLGNILYSFLVAILNIIFLIGLHLKINGYLLGYIFANSLTALYAIIVGHSYTSFLPSKKLDKKLFTSMVKYSIVLIPNSFMWWIMNASDRIMVSDMVGVSANGIYAISYKIPTILSVLTNIFNRAWGYSAIREQDSSDEESFNNHVLNLLTSFVMLAGIGILAFTKPFLKVYVSDDFYSAWKYVPFLIVGSVYMTFGTFFATSYTVHKDNWGFLLSGSLGALLNVILNYLLIPKYGVYGAAFATCISYITVFLYRFINTKKYIKYNIHTKEFIVGSALLIATSIIIYVDNYIGFLIQIGIFILAIAFYFTTIKSFSHQLISALHNRKKG